MKYTNSWISYSTFARGLLAVMATLPVIERKHVVKVGAQSGAGWRITSVALSGAASYVLH